MCASLRQYKEDTHSESQLTVIQLGGEKLGICGRLTLGRVLVILLWRETVQQKTEDKDATSTLIQKATN